LRYKGFNDVRGGGHFSGRLTAPLCFVGAVAGQILEKRGIYTGAHIAEIHKIKDDSFDPVVTTREDILAVREKAFPVLNDEKGKRMIRDIEKARNCLDSVGGVVECITINVPAGIGSPIFDGLENSIAQLIFGIPAVKGLEFGAGFNVARMRGSECNDAFFVKNGRVETKTNNNGGINGGISNGMPVIIKCAVKPTPSIYKEQDTVDFMAGENSKIIIEGRHDPAIVHRARAVADSMAAFAIADALVSRYGTDWLGGN
ncbi:MAG: chorismate synthase, partial [Clostridia bacterium]|nr:chorismate synthase [Clostridia bacterium]